MILNTDSYYYIGSTHKHCEDYALSGLKSFSSFEDSAYCLISDGCSGSVNTDFGARIISKCAENKLKWNLPSENVFRARVLADIDLNCNTLELNLECLDATLLFVQSTKDEYEVRVYGDGSILKLREDGNIEYTFIEYPSNAPLYLNYYINNNRMLAYKEHYGLLRKVYKYVITPTNFSITMDSDTSGEPYIETGYTDYKVIAVSSDGIASFAKFINKNPEAADMVEIVRQVMDFKSIRGKFIERRLNGLNNYCEKNNLKHTDDFSIAGISYEK